MARVGNKAIPATPLQRGAWWALGLGAALAAAAAFVEIHYGPEVVYQDDTLRITFTLLVRGALMVPAGVALRVWTMAKKDASALDERDRDILERAPGVQAPATILTLAIWVVALTEHFRGSAGVPTLYLYLVFWSCIVMHALALPLGILLGYRRR